jgi:hypothetical protein
MDDKNELLPNEQAWDAAHAEKPFRDHLAEKPDLSEEVKKEFLEAAKVAAQDAVDEYNSTKSLTGEQIVGLKNLLGRDKNRYEFLKEKVKENTGSDYRTDLAVQFMDSLTNSAVETIITDDTDINEKALKISKLNSNIIEGAVAAAKETLPNRAFKDFMSFRNDPDSLNQFARAYQITSLITGKLDNATGSSLVYGEITKNPHDKLIKDNLSLINTLRKSHSDILVIGGSDSLLTKFDRRMALDMKLLWHPSTQDYNEMKGK